jgi:ABC-type polysaccharide/polyol phosphate export permease
LRYKSVFWVSLTNFRVWTHLGWRDLRAQYARTKLGPWWSATSLAAIVLGSSIAIGLVGNNKALSLTPQLGIGLAIWTLVSVSLNDGSDLFESERGVLLNSTIDELSLVFRLIWRNTIIFFHNLPVVALALLIGGYKLSWHIVLFLPLARSFCTTHSLEARPQVSSAVSHPSGILSYPNLLVSTSNRANEDSFQYQPNWLVSRSH